MAFGKISLKGRALRYLAQREHSRIELERKLRAHEEEPGELGQALDDLQAKGFISETRAAESVVHHRASRMGHARIRQELQAKGIAPEVAAAALESLAGTEFERARRVWASRYGELPEDAKNRARQARFLMGRGFSADVVRKVLAGRWMAEDDPDSSA